jgi:hypothetical protein
VGAAGRIRRALSRRSAWPSDLLRLGRVGAFYLLHEPQWVHRRVETAEMLDELMARRRLTVDLSLPSDDQAVCGQAGGLCIFYVPLMRLRKHPPIRGIDVRGESGDALALLTSK